MTTAPESHEPSGSQNITDADRATDHTNADPADVDHSETNRGETGRAESEHPAPAIRAVGLGLVGDHGRVFGPLDLEISRGGLTVLRGHPGNGRTCLLLSLAGRMAPSEGELEVLGRTGTREIFTQSAIAGFSGIDTLDPAVTVRTVVAEQRAWMSPWWKLRSRTGPAELREVLGPVYGDLRLPDPASYVGDLTELDRMLVRVALARYEGTPILVVDDIEQVRVLEDRARFLGRLAEIAHADGTTIILSSVDDLPAGSPAHHLVTVPATKEGLE
ncbi:ABC transporter ATP-binding protein [Dietzia alimentaria]|uniref:ATP-binding cassette domain-containing protein n=1 Tax=Dietzia alimentaria TaxID=665550 RepID=UPI00029B0107|nr:ATP-binding cassette domain-containing protein [Dietzia alimentaria]